MKNLLIFVVAFFMIFSVFSGCEEKQSLYTDSVFEGYDEVLNVTEYGVVGNSLENAKSNTRILNNLIKGCEENTAIYFPENKYYFEAGRGCINIDNKNSLLFYGDNALIINASFDPTVEITDFNYHDSMTVALHNSKNIRIEGLNFDYYRFTQVCGKVVEKSGNATVIELDSRFLSGDEKPAITGNEIVSAVAVLNESGAAVGDFYADGNFPCYLEGNRFYITGDFGKRGAEVVARFCLSTAPEFYAKETENLTIHNVRSFSSPAAAFLMNGEGNRNFNFDNVIVAPPDGAVWRWGANADGIFINCMRGEVNITNCKFIGMGDDALNVHSTAAKVISVNDNVIKLNYAYNGESIGEKWVNKGDNLIFYNSDFSFSAKASVVEVDDSEVALNLSEGAVSIGDFVENIDHSPEVNIKNVTVDGGRARAFLIQTDNVKIENCNISNLYLAGIIISPDIIRWNEMGPSENVTISGCTFNNVCVGATASCKGAIFSASSHEGDITEEIIHKNIVITDNVFANIFAPSINLTSVDGVIIKDNIYQNDFIKPVTSNCKNVSIE